MCGIAGIVDLAGRPILDAEGLARTLAHELSHRGPDGEGAWLAPSRDAVLVHRRLAIIDPTPGGAQPMATPDGRHRIVFNGEIYNYRDLRGGLESRGERFTTSSDTEVLLRLIVRDGPAALARVRGMFAFACWSDDDQSLLVARDRFGIKPLYVAESAERVAFASELDALRATRAIDGSPSTAAVRAYLTWGSVPQPLTWLDRVEMLEPGTWRTWRRGAAARTGTFADTRDAYVGRHDEALPESEWRQRVANAVRDSIRAHLVADVPVGVFLSGGIDSSAIVSTAAAIGAGNLRTFTVGFEGDSSEAAQAEQFARALGTRHETIDLDSHALAREVPAFLASVDQPTVDGVNSFVVSKAVARTGIKAVLSGTGGDEMFGGYPSFLRLPRAVAWKQRLGGAWPLVAGAGHAVLPPRLRPRWMQFVRSDGALADAYRVQRGLFTDQELDVIAGPALRDRSAPGSPVLSRRLQPAGSERPLAAVARLESRHSLTSQLLRDIDATSMAHGLEVRVPFVDHELLATVWPRLGDRPELLAHKKLLTGTLDPPLPASIADARKQTFTLPFARWMTGDLEPIVRDGMQRAVDAGWIAAGAPDRVWTAWRAGHSHWTRPWSLAVLGHCLSGAAV